MQAAWGLGVGDLFCLQPHEVPARRALRPERAKTIDAQHDAPTFELMKGGTKRVAMLGVPGIGNSRNLALGLWRLVTGQLEGLPQPEAIVFEARQSKTVLACQ